MSRTDHPEQIGERLIDYWAMMQRAQALFLRAAQISVKAVAAGEFSVADTTSIMAAYAKVGMAMAARPADLLAIQQSAFANMANVWMSGWTGGKREVKDRRFADEAWNEDPLGRVCRDVHLALEKAVREILDQFPKGSKEQLRVQFYTRQILSALAPSNFLALNPQARQRLLETDGESLLDGPHWSRPYRTADGGFMSVQCLEPKFYAEFVARLGLAGDPDLERQFDRALWPESSRRLEELFASRTRAEWEAVFGEGDACVAPVLTPEEAMAHPMNAARQVWQVVDGALQAAPAPRFAHKPGWQPRPAPAPGADTAAILAELGGESA